MKQLIKDFPNHLDHALEIGASSKIKFSSSFNNIVICGLGGSGIGGRIASELVADECTWPIILHNTYGLPYFAGPDTLVIISSYSGNTEETLDAMHMAIEKGCQICCITSGGEVMDLAQSHGISTIEIPGGNPPRSMLGYSLTSLLFVFAHIEALSNSFADEIEHCAGWLRSSAGVIEDTANDMANELVGKIPVLYSSTDREGLAVRWRQQFNENSKMLCWHHVLPEMNHNELVGWDGPIEDVVVVLLEDDDDHERVKMRMEISEGIFSKTNRVIKAPSCGSNPIERAFYTIHLGDRLSVILAERQGIDPMTIDNIDLLKNTLAKL